MEHLGVNLGTYIFLLRKNIYLNNIVGNLHEIQIEVRTCG